MDDTIWKTEGKFWAWLRGGLRRSIWMRHPVKLALLNQERFRAPLGVNGREVWCCVCAMCGEIKRQPDCQVDHKVPAGSLTCREDIGPFVERLALVTVEDLRILCKPCHKEVSAQERRASKTKKKDA